MTPQKATNISKGSRINWKHSAIVLVFAIIGGGAILGCVTKQETAPDQLPATNTPQTEAAIEQMAVGYMVTRLHYSQAEVDSYKTVIEPKTAEVFALYNESTSLKFVNLNKLWILVESSPEDFIFNLSSGRCVYVQPEIDEKCPGDCTKAALLRDLAATADNAWGVSEEEALAMLEESGFEYTSNLTEIYLIYFIIPPIFTPDVEGGCYLTGVTLYMNTSLYATKGKEVLCHTTEHMCVQ